MAEETIAPEVKVETVVNPVVVPVVEAPKVDDLFKRVSTAPKTVEQPKIATNEFGLTEEDYAKVTTDPTLSKYYKSLVSGANKKFQETAELRKTYEAKVNEKWTPSKIQELLNNPDFVMSAQSVVTSQAPKSSGMSDQEWSALSDTDKAKFSALEARQSQMEQLLQRERQGKEDEVLKSKYPDYAPDIVGTTVSKLVKGEVNATREDIWKVINYDNHVRRAYELGKQDASVDVKEKMGASSIEGYNTTAPREVVEPVKGESNTSYFKRIVLNRMLQNKK